MRRYDIIERLTINATRSQGSLRSRIFPQTSYDGGVKMTIKETLAIEKNTIYD